MILLFCMDVPYLAFEKLETEKKTMIFFYRPISYTVTHTTAMLPCNMANFDIF